jgi:hypothetical protein
MKFTDEALNVVRVPYTEVSGKKWEIAIQPNPGALTKEQQWLASCYDTKWLPWPKFRVWGANREEAGDKAVAAIQASELAKFRSRK